MAQPYTFDNWGQIIDAEELGVTLKDWPSSGPPLTTHDDTLSGSPSNLIGWRSTADLAITFCVGDIAGVAPFPIGYQIPRTVPCRLLRADQVLKDIPTCSLGYIYRGNPYANFQRWGPLDWGNGDSYYASVSGPQGCYTVADLVHYCNNSNILILGIAWGNYGGVPIEWFQTNGGTTLHNSMPNGAEDTYYAALSALTGAGVEIGLDIAGDAGHLVYPANNGAYTAANIAAASVEAIRQYAEVRNANSIDVCWTVDNTGSMGSRQETMKEAAVLVTQALLDEGYDAWFAYTNFAEFNANDAAKRYPGTSAYGWDDWPWTPEDPGGDDPYHMRFEFGPLNAERQAAFAALDIPGQGGNDGPETNVEALCRIYQARQLILNAYFKDDGRHIEAWHHPSIH